MVNSGQNTRYTTCAQDVHNAYAQISINERKHKVNGSQALTERVNLSVTPGVLL